MKIWTSGCFDILHVGHIELFRYAKSLGDELVVGVDSDEKIRLDKEYKDLSEVAKVFATLKFLKGVVVFRDKIEKVKSKTPHFLPPASKNKIEFQLLHEDVLEKFFKYYNEITQSPEHRDLRAAKRLGKYTPTMELLERFDC